MLAFAGDVVAGWELLDDLDIRGETSAGEDSFKQVMAEQGVLRHPAGKRCLEDIDVVDAFAGIRTLTEEVLIDVGDGSGVRVHTTGAGKDPLIERTLAADRQRGRYPGLKDGVPINDAPLDFAKHRSIQRMSHLTDQLRSRISR